jgi:hypothetical protein
MDIRLIEIPVAEEKVPLYTFYNHTKDYTPFLIDKFDVEKAIALYYAVCERYGVECTYRDGVRKRAITLSMPIERSFAVESPNYNEILVPESAYVEYVNPENGSAKFVYLHSDGNLYSVYKSKKSMFVNLMSNKYVSDTFPPLVSPELVTISLN